jgi:hypothetical protein
MGGDAGKPPASRIAATLEFEREHKACELRLGVNWHRLVDAFRLQVVEIDHRTATRRDARQRHHPRGSAFDEQRQKLRGQGEMPQIIGAELKFETVCRGLALRRRHDTGIVDQRIDPVVLIAQPFRTGRDRCEVCEIDRLEADRSMRNCRSDALHSFQTFGRIAPENDDMAICPRKSDCRFKAEATCPRDDDCSTFLRRNVLCGPIVLHAKSFREEGGGRRRAARLTARLRP